jgi:hypothetical protein
MACRSVLADELDQVVNESFAAVANLLLLQKELDLSHQVLRKPHG